MMSDDEGRVVVDRGHQPIVGLEDGGLLPMTCP